MWFKTNEGLYLHSSIVILIVLGIGVTLAIIPYLHSSIVILIVV